MFQMPAKAGIVVFLLLFMNKFLNAQARLDVVQGSSNVNAYSHSIVESPIAPCPTENVVNNGIQLTQTIGQPNRLWGGASTYIKRGLPNCKISSQGTGSMVIDGDGSATARVLWWCHSMTQYDCLDPDCGWFATDTSILNSYIMLRITGVPDGTPVQVSYHWKHFSSIASKSEAGAEDYAEIQNASLNLFNQVGFGANMNLSGNIKFAQKKSGDTTITYNTVAGDSLIIQVSAKTMAHIEPPAVTPQNEREDDASADFYGYVIITVSSPANPGAIAVDTCPTEILLYSVDIGGDAEYSDPTPNGNELLDPGDLYVAGSSLPIPFFNDSLIFGFDPAPSVGNPAGTCMPGPLQQWQHVLNFDLDGTDRIDYNLRANLTNYGLGKPSIPKYNSDCVYHPNYMLFSVDEDRGINFSNSANCNIPSKFDNADSLFVRGTTAGKDEIMAGHIFNYLGTNAYIGTYFLYRNEADVSPLLAPSPPSLFPPDLNDDIDALDMVADPALCSHQYFSVDHEAHYIHKGDTLRPGFIYQYIQPDSIFGVIHPMLHLGLSNEIDIDAFEFAWLWDTAQLRYGLGIVFSVSANDPFDPTDYTGGLAPGALYASLLNGSYFEMLPAIGAGMNIDALTFFCGPFTGHGAVYVPGTIFPVNVEEPDENGLAMNLYPNPNKGEFNVEFSLQQPSDVEVHITDVNGKTIWLKYEQLNSGTQLITVPLNNIHSGVYFVELKAGNTSVKKRAVVVR